VVEGLGRAEICGTTRRFSTGTKRSDPSTTTTTRMNFTEEPKHKKPMFPLALLILIDVSFRMIPALLVTILWNGVIAQSLPLPVLPFLVVYSIFLVHYLFVNFSDAVLTGLMVEFKTHYFQNQSNND
jgi:hypothetical protein